MERDYPDNAAYRRLYGRCRVFPPRSQLKRQGERGGNFFSDYLAIAGFAPRHGFKPPRPATRRSGRRNMRHGYSQNLTAIVRRYGYLASLFIPCPPIISDYTTESPNRLPTVSIWDSPAALAAFFHPPRPATFSSATVAADSSPTTAANPWFPTSIEL